MAGVVLLSWSTRTVMHEQVIASIIDDNCCGMNDVAFRTAPPIGGLSCFPCWRSRFRVVRSQLCFFTIMKGSGKSRRGLTSIFALLLLVSQLVAAFLISSPLPLYLRDPQLRVGTNLYFPERLADLCSGSDLNW